ncbi:MAG: J domain-containing protein [Microcoleus sp.]
MAATDFKDYYAILGLTKTANADEIKKTFRKLARKYHPDMNPGNKEAEARFKEVNEAYEVLADPEKRQKYDQYGQYWKQAAATPGGWPGGGGTAVDFGGVDFSQYGSFDEFINALLGRAGGAGAGAGRSGKWNYSNYRSTSGGPTGFGGFEDFAGYENRATSTSLDTEVAISLTLGEAFRGTSKRVATGEVSIPAGVKTGSKIRVKGKGQVDPYTKQHGDLYLKLEVLPHPFFQFEGENLVCEVPITPDEAVLGALIEVPAPEGMITVKFPAGIRSGQSLRLRGKGWPKPKKDERTDLLVKVAIVPPKELTTVDRECYEKIKTNRTFNPRSNFNQVLL